MDGRLAATVLLLAGAGGAAAVAVRGALRSGGRVDARLRGLRDQPAAPDRVAAVRKLAEGTLPKIGTSLMPEDERERSRLQARLMHAGLYGQQAMKVFLGAKLMLMFLPVAAGAALAGLGLVPPLYGLLGGIYAGGSGLVVPSMWLDRKKKARQAIFRRSMPDAMDLLVICVEGGLTLGAALARIAESMRTVHPMLAGELEIVRREMQLGRSAGEALRSFSERTDLEEIRALASVIVQAERLGAGLAKSLRVHAETLRQKRQQRAEELAQKAATKVLIPTLFCIFPAIFVVILGPAMIQLQRSLASRP